MTENTTNKLDALKQEILLRKLKKTAVPRAQPSAASVIERADRSRPLPLSWSQQRLWFLEQLDGAGSAYHIPGALKLLGRLDHTALQSALDAIVARHEILRTTIRTEAGEGWQQVAEPGALRFALRSADIAPTLKSLGAAEREAEIQRRIRQETVAPFDLAQGPLIRGLLLKCGEEEHVLCIVMHHIISDGWSIGVLTQEFAALYAAFSQGQANPAAVLQPLDIQYADYAQWQRGWLAGELLQKQLDHWKQELAGAPALLELPSDRARPPVQSYAGAGFKFNLTPQLGAGLRALAKQADVTLFMILYAGWAVLLSRLSGQNDIVIGAPVANRSRTELEKLIGFFVNTLALRVQIDPEQSVQALLADVKRHTLAAYAHQDVPFEQVVEAVKPPRSMSHSPVFQVLLALQNAPQGELQLPGLRLAGQEIPGSTAQFDLSLVLHEGADVIRGDLQYASDLFDATTIERWIGYYKTVLAAMVEDVTRPVAALPLLGNAERTQILKGFNARHAEFPQQQTIAERFEAQVQRVPQAIAVSCDGASLSYAELNARANQLARHLRTLGVGPDKLVAICVERSPDMIVGLLGILKAGGAYVPIDPSYPQDRIDYMLSDAKPAVILTQASLQPLLAGTPATLIALDSDAAGIARQSAENLASGETGLQPHHLAYIIYTSGSTGQPKGVMIEQRNVTRLFDATDDWYHFDEGDVWTLFHSFAFDFSVWEIFGALLYGGRLVIVPHLTARSPQDFYRLLCVEGVTILNQTPSAFRQLIAAQGEALERGETHLQQRLRAVIFGGEALEMHALQPWVARNGVDQPQLINMYGITETTVHVTYRRLRRAEIEGGQGSNVGVAIPDLQLYLLDERKQPVPIGATGEIYVGGAGLARGYLNRPELTQERFIKDPFGTAPDARLYKSGDLGRWKADGTIEYLGRNDHQVKIRGFRIELGEIEAQLARNAAVKDAVVIAREDRPGDKRLVAYLTTRDGSVPDVDALRAELKTVLPEYMLPSAYVVLAELPLTANGKLDRKALPAPEYGASATRLYVAPEGEIEETIAAIWQDILHLGEEGRVGRHDNFFDLGGHSLLIVQMLERLRQAGLSTDVRSVFNHPTPASLAEQISRSGMPAAALTAPPNLIPPGCTAITPDMLPLVRLSQGEIDGIAASVHGGMRNIQDIYPLAPLQEGILFHHLLSEQGDAYVLPILMAVESEERLDAFVGALQRVVGRHDILRSAILWQGLPRAVQVVQRHVEVPIERFELDAGRDVRAQLDARLAPQRQRIDLRRAPLLRLQVAADPHSARQYLILQFHHIISDHFSLEIVLEEIVAMLAGHGEALPQPVAYRGFVAQALALLEKNDAEAFFRARLADVDEPTAPFGLLDVHGDGSRIEEHHEDVAPELARRLRHVARERQVSVATLFHVAMALVLGRASGRQDVVFGSVLSGRLQGTAGADKVLGMFINTLPLRFDLQGRSVRQLVEHAHRELIELLKHEQASLALAQRCSAVPASTPLFSAVLNYRHTAPAGGANAEGIEVLSSQERTNYPFTLNVDDLGSGFRIEAQTDRRIEPARVTGYLQAALAALVGALESAPETSLVELAIMPAAEREQILKGFNATAVAYPQGQTLHQLFEAQVARQPEAIAASCEGRQLSYAELNHRSNQLARHLRQHGIGADSLVAICIERSLEMIVGLMGILKAGGAYVPVDPSYPADRIAYMLQDANPAVILTQSSLKPTLPQTAAQVFALDADWAVIGEHDDGNLDGKALGLTPRNLAYVIYTSGSTGKPKGAMNEHRAVVNRLQWMQDAYRLSEQDRILQKTPFSFDVSVWEFFWPLLAGARLVFAKPQGHQDPAYLTQLIQDAGITTLHFVPSMLQVFVDQPGVEACRSLRHIVCSGEELPLALQNRCLERLPQARLHNLYGPTEAAIDVTYWECHLDPRQTRVPIGRPIANIQMYVLDERLQPVPIGVAGEIHIGGIGVARGYLNRPELTAERFIPDPFSSDGEARLYKTGDLGRWTNEGVIEYLGRNDHQVKIRGFRIELGEIESQLARHEGIKEAVVIAREDRPGAAYDRRLVAYVTLKDGKTLDLDAVRSQLKSVLPDYMVPSAWVVLDAFPLSPNGKLDRKALPAPEAGAHGAGREYEAPQGQLEAQIAALWQELLALPTEHPVGRHDNYFDLGGHSLTAMQLVARLGQLLGRPVPVRSIFEAPTVAQLAAALANEETAAASLADIPIAPPRDYYPLSHAQRRLWFLTQIGDATSAYNIPAALRFKGPFDAARMNAALDALVARHAPLRSTIIPMEGEPMQWLGEAYHVDVPQSDIANEATLAQALTDFALEPFNLETGPLLRAHLYRRGPDEHILAVAVHHIVADGWSIEIALREVANSYAQAYQGQGAVLPPLAVEYVDYSLWQRELLDGGHLDGQRQYWLDRLGGELPMLQLPTDRPRPTVQSFNGGQYHQPVPEALRSQIADYCTQHQITPYMLLLAIYQILMSRLSGQHDILIGTPLAGRQHPQVHDLVGFFVNTLVLRGDLSDDARVKDYLQRVRSDALDAYANQDYPFDLLVDQLNSRRDLSRQAVFDTTFTVETRSRPALQSRDLDAALQIEPVAIDVPRAKFDLGATVAYDEQNMSLMFEYSADLFDAATIARYAGYYLNLLADAIAHPERRLSELTMLDAAERAELLGAHGQFAGIAKHYEIRDHLAARIERMAQAHAQQVAVRLDGQSLTYAELDQRANRLAQHLSARGIGIEDAVILCLERSFDMLISILAVLKTGACYVPIEPGLPADRLRYLIQDSGARCLISHGKSSERLQNLADNEGLALQADQLVCLTRDAAAIAAQPAQPLDRAIDPESRAYIIYTSGSTGQPKGCQLTHANVLRLFQACEARFDFSCEQTQHVWTLFHSYAFDFSVWEIFGALLYGGRLVVVPQTVTRSPADFADLLKQEQVTLLSQTPSAFLRLLEGAIVEASERAGQKDENKNKRQAHWASHLRYVVFGGEALEYASLRPWYRHQLNPATHLINMYGITETTVHVTWREVSEADVEAGAAARSSSNVGRPLADLTSYILDPHGEPQPVGVTGELYIGGAGLARGYLNRPGLTAERFIANPFATEADAGSRLYRTGDLARWTTDGDIDYLGRIDHQVKIHGYRIELGEIEAQLARHPAISICVVMAVKDPRTLQDRLVAYYSATEALTATQLRSHLGATLPEYMIPHSFVQVDKMPLTINGKIDRARLQTNLAVRPQLDVPYVMPETPLEIRLAKIWSEVLGVDQVGLRDNFFDLGGDSFSAYRLMTRISDDLGRDLALESIFRTQTIGAMAAALDQEQAEQEESSLVMIQPGEAGRIPFFCAHQAGGDVLSFRSLAQALGSERPFYGVQSAGRLLGESQHHTLEEMCADYLKDIRAVQPHGPYLIGGHSMGGKVAYELARQLEEAGEQVGVLAIIDSDIINKNTSMIDSLMLLSETFRLNIQREELAKLEPKHMMDYLLTVGKKRFARVLEIAFDMDLLPRGFRTRDAEMFLNRIATNIHVSDAYVAPPIQTPVSLFLATDHTENSYIIDVDAWRKVALGGVEPIEVPGNHLNLIQKPHIDTLGPILKRLVEQAEKKLTQ